MTNKGEYFTSGLLLFVWLLLFPGMFGLAQVSAQTAPHRTLTVCLKELSAKQKVHISFSPSLTNRIYPRQTSTEGTITEALDRLLKAENMDYKIVEGVYVVYPHKKEPVITKKPSLSVPRPVVKRDTLHPVLAHRDTSLFTPQIKTSPPDRHLPIIVPAPASLLRVPRWVVKTNLLYDVTATVNFGVEFAVNDHWTIDISGNYNGWTLPGNRKWKHILLQPEARYWFCERFSGHFIGAHLHGGLFNIGKLPPAGGLISENMQRKRYEGYFYGAGISYGYHWPFYKRWGLEPTLGIGYARIIYDKFPCGTCGKRIKSGAKNYFGPTKIAISLIYTIK